MEDEDQRGHCKSIMAVQATACLAKAGRSYVCLVSIVLDQQFLPS